MATQKVLSVRDIAQVLDISNQGVHLYINTKKLPATQDKGEGAYLPPYKISQSDFDNFLRARVKEHREKASKLEACIGKGGR